MDGDLDGRARGPRHRKNATCWPIGLPRLDARGGRIDRGSVRGIAGLVGGRIARIRQNDVYAASDTGMPPVPLVAQQGANAQIFRPWAPLVPNALAVLQRVKHRIGGISENVSRW